MASCNLLLFTLRVEMPGDGVGGGWGGRGPGGCGGGDNDADPGGGGNGVKLTGDSYDPDVARGRDTAPDN